MKRLVAVKRAAGLSDAEVAAALAADGATLVPGASRVVLDVVMPDQALYRAKNPNAPLGPPRWDGLLWAYDVDGDVPPTPSWASEVAAYDVVEHPGFTDEDVAGEPAVKQVSWVAKLSGLSDDEFHQHYREHIDVTRDHHGCVRYQQNDVVRVHGIAPHADGFSELWFRDPGEFAERFYLHPDSVPVVRADTTEFIDFGRTSSMVVVPGK